MKRLFVLFALIVCLLSFCGCAARMPASASPKPDVSEEITPGSIPTTTPAGSDKLACIVIGTTADIEKAVAGEYNYDTLSSGASQLPLVQQDALGVYHPLLASWETQDAQTWTYTIRSGMCWSDGVPVTASDILFTLEQEDRSGSANLIDQTDSEGNTTKAKYLRYALSDDGTSISLTLATANVRELSNMTTFRVQPRHILEGNPAPTADDLRVSCGPYRLERFDRNAGTLTFAANPYYPEETKVDTLVYRLFDSEDTLYLALTNGDIDLCWAYSAGVSGSYLDVLAASDAVELLRVSAVNAPAVLAFNNSASPFACEALRKAVAAALDYQTLRFYVGSDQAVVASKGFVPPATVGYKETESLVTDLAAAEAWMKEAGYSRNEDGRFTDASGIPFSFTLTYRSDKSVQVSCGELIKNALEDFGIAVNLEGLDSSSYNAKTSNKFSENHITMECALYGFTAGGMGMGNGLGSIYVDGSHPVQGGCQVYDEAFTALLEQAATAGTVEAYAEAAGALQDYYAEHLPLLALYWDSMSYAASSHYTGLTADGVFGLNHVGNWSSITLK